MLWCIAGWLRGSLALELDLHGLFAGSLEPELDFHGLFAGSLARELNSHGLFAGSLARELDVMVSLPEVSHESSTSMVSFRYGFPLDPLFWEPAGLCRDYAEQSFMAPGLSLVFGGSV